jgi:DNA-binding response OmpR family regulator
MKKVLVVEDEENISNLICDTLSLGGYAYDVAFDGEKAVEKVLKENYSLILLDIMLPKLDGFEVMEKIKNKDIPIIFLSAKNDVSSIVKGLQNGGQDYITKPFEPLELLARIELRIKKDNEEICKYKNIEVNYSERIVYKDNEEVFLAPKEYELLVLLLKNIGISLSRDIILNKIWDIEADIETRTVDYHIQQLRKKLDLKNEIKTINKIGYRIEKE